MQPYLAAVLLFMILSVAYVSPVLEGHRLVQTDIANWMGMAREIMDFREDTGEEALWTNSMFGGMPAFQISVIWANNIAGFFHDIMTLWLPRPADMIFLYFAGFFIFLLLLKVNPWIALAGAVGFAFSSYHFIIIEAGHNSKAVAIGYMAPVMGAIIYTFKGNLYKGGLLFAIFMGLQLYANHYQITYYLGIIAAIYGIFILIEYLKEKRLNSFIKRLAVLVAALVVAIGINIGNFWGTYSYTSETMRGGSEITLRDEVHDSGLDKEYITAWSYGVGETLTFLIPNAKGGTTMALGNNERALEEVEPAYRGIIAQENHYWGNQPFTSGPVYIGAVVLFFFFLGIFHIRGPIKNSFLVAVAVSVLLSWGKNFMPLTEFFIDYFPGYDKFRAVSMTLVIAELCIPAIAFLGLYRLYEKPGIISLKDSSFLTAMGLTAGLSLLLYLFPRLFLSFTSEMEAQGYADMAAREPGMAAQINEFLYNLEKARIHIFRADAIRSFLFASAAGIVTILFAMKKIGRPVFVILIVLLLITDMWPVNRRYLNNENFAPRRRVERPFQMREADQQILQDNDQFRVLDISENTFNSSRTSYYHHSIGGYHGAKLQRYQDLIDFHIMDEIRSIAGVVSGREQERSLSEVLAENTVINMLNTRYIIERPDSRPLNNPYAKGNAWFVNDIEFVPNADEELLGLEGLDINSTALVDERFAHYIEGSGFGDDVDASIELSYYQPNRLVYSYSSSSPQITIFSEVYYPKGWEVYINGEKTSHFRANYILRGMVLPAGDLEIEFRFRPRPYYTGQYIALVFSSLLVAGILAYAFIQFRKIVKNRQHRQDEAAGD